MITGSAAGGVCGAVSGGFVWPVSCTRPVGASLLTIQLVGWKTREAIFHAGQEGNPDNSTPPRVDGFGHPPYVRLGIASKLAPTGCGICRVLGFWQLVGWKTREAIFHAGQEGNPDNSTLPRVDGFGHPPYVRRGIASKLAPTGCGICRAVGFWQIQKRRADQLAFSFCYVSLSPRDSDAVSTACRRHGCP